MEPTPPLNKIPSDPPPYPGTAGEVSEAGPSSSTLPAPAPSNPVAAAPPTRPNTGRFRTEAEKQVRLRAAERAPIWSTHYLDPCLHMPSFKMPHHVTNITNIALTGLSSGPKTLYNQTIGAPIDGMAKAAKGWLLTVDGKFETEKGGIELALGIVDSGVQGWALENGRKMARVEVKSRSGGIKIDLVSGMRLRACVFRADGFRWRSLLRARLT